MIDDFDSFGTFADGKDRHKVSVEDFNDIKNKATPEEVVHFQDWTAISRESILETFSNFDYKEHVLVDNGIWCLYIKRK